MITYVIIDVPLNIRLLFIGAGPSTFGITEFGSTSTKERSKISVEKRNDIVKPNISPNKQENSTSSNPSPPVSASVTPKTTPPETSTNATSKMADQKKPEGQEPKVNILQVGIIQTL